MSMYLKFLRLFLVLMVGVFFLVGSGPDRPVKKVDDNSSQNEPNSNVDNSTNGNSQNASNENNNDTPQQDEDTSSSNSSNNDTVYGDKIET